MVGESDIGKGERDCCERAMSARESEIGWPGDLVCYHLMKLVISFLIKYHVFRDLI